MLTDIEEARFRAKFVVVNDCWMWQGPLDKDGYGMFYLRRRNRRAHRVGWFMMHGEIPEGMVVNHACRNRSCVNPQHLEMITKRENALKDSSSRGAINARKTHCPEGHPYDRAYTVSGRTQRECSMCKRAAQRRLRRKWAQEGKQLSV